jgi:hypothetical protein
MTGKGISFLSHVRNYNDAFLKPDLNVRWGHLGKHYVVDDCEKGLVHQGNMFWITSVIVLRDGGNPSCKHLMVNRALIYSTIFKWPDERKKI